MFRQVGALVLLTAAGSGCTEPTRESAELEQLSLSGATMGTRWAAEVIAHPPSDPAGLQARVQSVLDGVDDSMSTWNPESELSRFNAARPSASEWFPVSRDTAFVVSRALHWWEQSGGAFDVTVAPLIQLWGFGSQQTSGAPDSTALDEALTRVGSQHLFCRIDPPALRKAVPELSVDLSAIAKGFAADQVAQLLRTSHVRAAMIEVGGEVVCFGSKRNGDAWSIGIEQAVVGVRRLDRALKLSDQALASSGDYRNFVEIDGQRYSHTLDPRSGRPARHTLAGVSITGPSCVDADAQCTTVMALGPDEGYDWAVAQNLSARLVVRDGTSFSVRCTPLFQRSFGEQ